MQVVSMSTPEYGIMKTDADMLQHMSNRYRMWEDFTKVVGDHIESYTVPQYGDFPNDQAAEWSTEEIKTSIKRYANRMGTNARGTAEAERDMLKIAHYAQMAWTKMRNEEKVYN